MPWIIIFRQTYRWVHQTTLDNIQGVCKTYAYMDWNRFMTAKGPMHYNVIVLPVEVCPLEWWVGYDRSGNSYTGKTASSYWIDPGIIVFANRDARIHFSKTMKGKQFIFLLNLVHDDCPRWVELIKVERNLPAACSFNCYNDNFISVTWSNPRYVEPIQTWHDTIPLPWPQGQVGRSKHWLVYPVGAAGVMEKYWKLVNVIAVQTE